MHLSPAFTTDSALAAAVGGAGIGIIATIYAVSNKKLMPSSTPNVHVWPGMLAASAILSSVLLPTFFEVGSLGNANLTRLAAAGVLVGVGSKLGAGCTCGNGIQGLASFSPASLAHVMAFMAIGAAAAVLGDNSAALQPTPTAFSWPLAATAAVLAVAQFALAKQNLVVASNVLCGCGFAVSLVQASMVKPSKIDGFLNVTSPRGWDPSLAFVMGGALAIAAIAWPLLGLPKAKAIKPWVNRPVDAATLVGGVCFGAGWGLGGLCPGPGIVATGTGSLPAAIWLGSMVAGRVLAGGGGSI